MSGWRCACAGVLALALASHSAKALGQVERTERRLTAIDLFDFAERAVAAGKVEEALILYDALARDPDIEVRSEARFRRGKLLLSRNRVREAAADFRRLLDEKPDAARVRLELAAALARLGDEPGARRQVRLAQAAGLPPEVAEQVSQFSRGLRSPKRAGGSLDVTLAPDTNVNRGTQARTLDTVIAPLLLSTDARAKSGLGLRLRPSGFIRQALTDRVSLVTRLTGSADLYRTANVNDVLVGATSSIEWRGESQQASIGLGVNKRWFGGEAFANTRLLTAEWLRQIDRTTQLTAQASHGVIRFPRNPLQNGTLQDVNVTGERALSARSGVALGATVTRQSAADPSFASWAFGPVGYGWLEVGRTTLFASGAARRLIGDERNFLFLDKRREWFVSGRMGAILRGFSVAGFAPTVRVGYELNRSTVAIFDYRRAYTEAGVTRTF